MEQKGYNDDNYCFACGSENPCGLKLEFRYDEENEEMVSVANFRKQFQGWKGVLHGGIISTVLDEVMVKVAHHRGYKCVTAELNVRFRKPAILSKQFTIKGNVTEARGRLVSAKGSIVDSDGITVATGTGKFVVVE
jgi:uncharacterized protein (TIGR00369 family)